MFGKVDFSTVDYRGKSGLLRNLCSVIPLIYTSKLGKAESFTINLVW